MKIAVRYYTRSGNTKKLAEAVAEAVAVEAKDFFALLGQRRAALDEHLMADMHAVKKAYGCDSSAHFGVQN